MALHVDNRSTPRLDYLQSDIALSKPSLKNNQKGKPNATEPMPERHHAFSKRGKKDKFGIAGFFGVFYLEVTNLSKLI